jgi:RNA polymerase sigma factor (sigma-70 family)
MEHNATVDVKNKSIIIFLFCNFLFQSGVLKATNQPNQLTRYHCFMTESEYNQCVNLYADNVYRFILKNLGHDADAQDVVQGAFEKMWINRQQVDNERCKSYLFTLAYHQMIDHIRKNKRVSLREEFREEVKITHHQQQDTKRLLNEALNKLNDVQKSLVMLKDYEGYSYQEIGEITGLNESQVKVYLHRARYRNYLRNGKL